MTENVASGSDRVAVQIGRTGGRRRRDDRTDTPPADVTVTNVNIVEGNARVGVQAAVVEGVLIIDF